MNCLDFINCFDMQSVGVRLETYSMLCWTKMSNTIPVLNVIIDCFNKKCKDLYGV